MNPNEIKIGMDVLTIDNRIGEVINIDKRQHPTIIYVKCCEILLPNQRSFSGAYLGWQLKNIQSEISEIAEKIAELGFHNLSNGGIINNKQIYLKATGLKKFSLKRWKNLKPILQAIASNDNYKNVDLHGIHHLIQPYAPMFRSQYNFTINDKPIGGFQVFSKRSDC